jgi:hypothetical protein
MTIPVQLPPRHQLRSVIAVVGCDGSGKSTLTADLLAHLGAERPAIYLYLGQSSGMILDWILGLPLVGGPLGRYLKRRSTRAHTETAKPASPDFMTALVIHLLSRWRFHKFRRMLALDRQGLVVIADRFPQAEVQGFWFDGPGLAEAGAASAPVRWLARRELRLYQRMAAHVPALLIRLNIDARTAHARKPDHKLKMLEEKTRMIPALAFNNAPILDLDGRTPYPQVLAAALAAARTVIGLEGVPNDIDCS